MKKSVLIASIISLLVIVFVVVAYFSQDRADQNVTNVEQVNVEGVGTPDGKTTSGVGTLSELASQNKDLECQVVFERGAEGAIEGTYFTSKGNLRGDFIVPAPEFGGEIVSSMIVGGSSMYVWSKIGEDTFGFKSDITDPKTAQMDTKEPVPRDQAVKYTCAEWATVDGSVFVPPAEVTFQDLNAVINAGMEYGTVPSGGEF